MAQPRKNLAHTNPTILTYVNFSLKAGEAFGATPKTPAPAFDSDGAVHN
jgi:hypothetical protein